MKGPALRLLIDVRRTWKCPRCGYEEHVGAEVTTVGCPCCPGVSMRLTEPHKVYADELLKLRERPKLGIDDIEESGDVSGFDEAPHIDELQADASAATAADSSQTSGGGNAEQPRKRRGKRPHKESRRGRHKQQTSPSPSDCEEE